MKLKTATFLAFIGSILLLLGVLSFVFNDFFGPIITDSIGLYMWVIGFLFLTIFFYSLNKNQK